jgi:sulfur relay (sulfurtransferase) complex TusBCD TusD component (DsrE family)
MARYAILLNAGPTAVGPPVNAVQYAFQLDEHGHEVRVFLDGPATKWPEELVSMADHPLREYYDEARERSLIAGVCGFCAHRYGTAQHCREADLQLYGDADTHGPDVGRLASEGHRLLTVG